MLAPSQQPVLNLQLHLLICRDGRGSPKETRTSTGPNLHSLWNGGRSIQGRPIHLWCLNGNSLYIRHPNNEPYPLHRPPSSTLLAQSLLDSGTLLSGRPSLPILGTSFAYSTNRNSRYSGTGRSYSDPPKRVSPTA